MATQKFWYGTVVTEKPARKTPGGEASSFVAKKGIEYKFDKEEGRWLRLLGSGLWVAKDWLKNIRVVEEETTPPVEPPPVDVITPPDEFTARWKDANGNVAVTREYKRV